MIYDREADCWTVRKAGGTYAVIVANALRYALVIAVFGAGLSLTGIGMSS